MAGSYLPLICFLFFLISNRSSWAKEFNSISSNYFVFSLANEEICNPISDKSFELPQLKKFKHTAILIHSAHIFDSWAFINNNKYCKFKIKVAEGYGVFAVVQKMSLRGSESQCLDYVTFSHGDKNKNTTKNRYCGNIDLQQTSKQLGLSLLEIIMNPGKTNNKVKNGTGMYEEYDPSGEITTEIFISKQKLLANETLDLMIAYTPYDKDCSPFTNHVESKHLTGDPCVDTKFHCDKVFNCHSKMCSDEIGCPTGEVGVTGTKVTVSAVTSIIMCFVIFFLCLWVCRRNEKLCWSPDCAGPGAISGNVSGLPVGQANQAITVSPQSFHVQNPSMLAVAVPSSVHDKDLPPSYDSLFPPQTTTTTTTTTTTSTATS